MLDGSFLYQKDFDKYRERFEKQGLNELYKSLYSNGRLSEDEETNSQAFEDFLRNYNRNLKLINTLTIDNHNLQLRVHELGIKNRIKKKLRRYKKPEDIKNYVSQSEMDDILNGKFVNKNYLPIISFGQEAHKLFRELSDESFEDGIRNLQKQIVSPKIKNPPLVSIIIPTRNGLAHLKRLFSDFDEVTKPYANYEIIIVDNASSDNTQEYLKSLADKYKLQVVYNSENKSFSESNNIAAKKARGSYLLFLNNDVSPTHGWLNNMMDTALKNKNIGAVGAKLVYPYKKDFENSYKIQHGGLGFRLEDDFIRPINMSMGEGFFTKNTAHEEEKAGVTAACLLVEKVKFDNVGGFDENYWYGYEDVDLCLKLYDEGYKNVINNAAVLFHHEFGTQGKVDNDTITSYRKNNIEVFKKKWQKKLYPLLWQSMLADDKKFIDKQLHFGFIVTEASDKTAAGDYYTAKELGSALEKKGHRVSYIGVRHSPNPHDIDADIDVLISMLDNYDVSKVLTTKPIKIAWCRNWFERWAEHSYFRDFDIVLTSSEIAQKFFKDKYFVESYLFKIATNRERFTKKYSDHELLGLESDIAFTGNYWQVPRDISEQLDVGRFGAKYSIKIYGKDWNQVKSLEPFWQGFAEYKNIPKIYAAGKILIDDAVFTTSKWGSVNSRVFDGAISGILVLTNGIEGNKNTFGGLLPTYSSKEELSELIEKYLGDEKLRQKKIDEIREYVLNHHTYEHRANQLMEILKNELPRKRINIKLPIPRWSEAKHWGDLHFGQGLKRELEKQDFTVKLQILPEWNQPNFAFANIVLRGLSVFTPPKEQLNIMWNISHPEKVSPEEYKGYDYAFIASKKHANALKKKGLSNIHTLYQCFDNSVFNDKAAEISNKYRTDILFVGNTRGQFRQAVKYALSWDKIDNYNFKVYGKGWDKFIDEKYWAGEHIDNSDLGSYYKNTKILLNDHWDDMIDYGFASNRLFDASAVGTFIISDKNSGIDDVFGKGLIEQFTNEKSLHNLLDKYINDEKSRNNKAGQAQKVVTKAHTFSHRSKELINEVDEFKSI